MSTSKPPVKYIFILGGVISGLGKGILAASLLADVIGIGDDPGFGTQQKMGSFAGVVITVLGLVGIRKGAK